MSCADRGTALRDAATGPTPGEHTLTEARNMRGIIVAISEDIDRRQDPRLASALRKPIASALEDYARDTYEILTSVNPDYQRRGHEGPWRDASGVRMPADVNDVVRVMRAVSQDAPNYAALRSAQTHECAVRMAAVPAKASEDSFRQPARACAAGLGHLDGIADDIPQAARHEWTSVVVTHLRATSPPPSYREDPEEHLTATWRRGLPKTVSSTWSFKDQITGLIETWAVGRGMGRDEDVVDTLQEDALNDASTSADETQEAMGCTRAPNERGCS